MLTGKLNTVTPPLSGSNAKFVGVLFLDMCVLIYGIFFTYLSPWGGG